uniref:Uncharacterized protein n=1 Tax=Rhizophora mucronata TaxID=61149 RepID=A0A2P2QNY4_RHIMU
MRQMRSLSNTLDNATDKLQWQGLFLYNGCIMNFLYNN